MRIIGFPQLICFAHILNNNLKTLFKVEKFEIIIEKCRTLIKHIRSSPKYTELLKLCQQSNQMQELKLKLDVVTRRNSVYDMLYRLLQNKKALNLLFIDHGEIQNILVTSQEWQTIEKIVAFLSPFSQITTLLSASSYPTISMIYPIIHNKKNSLLYECENDEKIIQQIKLELKLDFTRRIEELYCSENVKKIIYFSTFFDPRFKDLQQLNEEKINNKNIISLLKESLKLKQEKYSKLISKTFKANNTERIKLSLDFDSQFIKSLFQNNMERNNDSDENEQIPVHTTDIIQWWSQRSDVYPILSKESHEYLCIPSTSVPSEQIFSKAGHISNQKRSSIESKMLDQLIYISQNQLQFQKLNLQL
ncbi:hypothetical protein ABPG72_020070 [Tetrahymena utriculariae]